jgi:YebC/PmpR family DNA-binding regulatory protein
MSGHSKWSTIKRQKGAADQKRGLSFTKIANAITISVKLTGSGDPESNPRLRMALDEARTINMPKDNIQRAVDRGLGKLPGQIPEEILYEGFGPGKVAYILEGVTDNKLRTLQVVKNAFDRSGGGMGSSGSVSYMFKKTGEIRVEAKEGISNDEQILEIIDLGAEEVEDYEEEGKTFFLIYTEVSNLSKVSNFLTQNNYKVISSEPTYKPTITSEIKDKETAEKVIAFTEKLENMDDIQKVYANFDIPEELIDGN